MFIHHEPLVTVSSRREVKLSGLGFHFSKSDENFRTLAMKHANVSIKLLNWKQVSRRWHLAIPLRKK